MVHTEITFELQIQIKFEIYWLTEEISKSNSILCQQLSPSAIPH